MTSSLSPIFCNPARPPLKNASASDEVKLRITGTAMMLLLLHSEQALFKLPAKVDLKHRIADTESKLKISRIVQETQQISLCEAQGMVCKGILDVLCRPF